MHRHRSAVGTRTAHPGHEHSASHVQTEEIHIRNFDESQSYDLTLAVSMEDESVLSNTYHLTPGRQVRDRYRLSAGVYDVSVCVNDDRTETAECEIGATPERTALVEVGNGTVSVTQGLY